MQTKMCTHMYRDTDACTYSYMHADIDAYTHRDRDTNSHTHMYSCRHIHAHTHMYSCRDTNTHTYSQRHRYRCMHINISFYFIAIAQHNSVSRGEVLSPHPTDPVFVTSMAVKAVPALLPWT